MDELTFLSAVTMAEQVREKKIIPSNWLKRS
jgi:hypothetical protein